MNCKGNFVFKGLEKRDSGTFTDPNGRVVNYPESYVLKVDENTDNGIYERRFKVKVDNTVLLNKLKNLKPYDKVNLLFDINFYGSKVSVIPIDLVQ